MKPLSTNYSRSWSWPWFSEWELLKLHLRFWYLIQFTMKIWSRRWCSGVSVQFVCGMLLALVHHKPQPASVIISASHVTELGTLCYSWQRWVDSVILARIRQLRSEDPHCSSRYFPPDWFTINWRLNMQTNWRITYYRKLFMEVCVESKIPFLGEIEYTISFTDLVKTQMVAKILLFYFSKLP